MLASLGLGFLSNLLGPVGSFLAGPGGRIGLIVLAFVAWTFYQRHDATSACEEAELTRELVETQRLLAVANELAAKARSRADETAAELQIIAGERDAILSEIEQSGDSCSIPDDLLDRLRAIN